MAKNTARSAKNEAPSTKNEERPTGYVVRMINRRLGYGAVETMLQGYSSARWGKATSRFSPEYGCHYIDLTPEEYEACREDVFKAAHLQSRVWEPIFVVAPGAGAGGTGSGGILPPNQNQSAQPPSQYEEAAADHAHKCALVEFRAGYDLALEGKPIPDEASESAKEGHVAGTLVYRSRLVRLVAADPEIEAAAKVIYELWRAVDPEGAAHPWIEGGNSLKQDEARREARRTLAAPSGNTANTATTTAPGNEEPRLERSERTPQEPEGGSRGRASTDTKNQELPEITEKTPFAKLVAIAKKEGAPWKGVNTSAAMRKSIETHRTALIEKQQDRSDLAAIKQARKADAGQKTHPVKEAFDLVEQQRALIEKKPQGAQA